MSGFIDPLLIMALTLNFVALGVSRIRGIINAVALQGILLGTLPLFVHPGPMPGNRSTESVRKFPRASGNTKPITSTAC